MRARRHAGRVVAKAASALVVPTRRHRRVVALCYHSIHPDKPFATLTPDLFDRHLEWLKDTCEVTSLDDDSMSRAFADDADARPLVMLTFDDGYDDNFEFALPLLMKHDVKATFFLTTGLLQREPETMDRFARERACPPDMLGALTWAQIAEMHSEGMVIGAHTHTHRNLATLTDADASRELGLSKQILEDHLGTCVTVMAYPYGKPGAHFDKRRTVQLVKDNGYLAAASVTFRGVRPSDSSYAVPRFFVARSSVDELSEKVLGRWDAVGWWHDHAPRGAQRVLSPTDFGH